MGVYTQVEVKTFDDELRRFRAMDTKTSDAVHEVVGRWIKKFFIEGYESKHLVSIEQLLNSYNENIRDDLEIVFYACLSKAMRLNI